jgi:hypothetical protein
MAKKDKGDFLSRAGQKTKKGYRATTAFITKKKIKHGAQFSKYAGPTVGMFKKTGAGVLGVGKFALKHGALGFPGLIATGVYYGAKSIGKKAGAKKFQYPGYREFNKKGRKII